MNSKDVREILDAEGLKDWTFDLKLTEDCTREGLTQFKTKSILLQNADLPLVLHEITHIKLGKSGHDSEFAHQYMYLVRKYWGFKRTWEVAVDRIAQLEHELRIERGTK